MRGTATAGAGTMRGIPKSKPGKKAPAGTSTLPLSSEDESVSATTLETSGGSHATSPSGSERHSDVLVGPAGKSPGTFPDTVVRDPETCQMFKALAQHIEKWKILGRYLGLGDQELDEIERSNHFTAERCFKMLVTWGRNCRGKYSELEAGICNIRREDFVEEIRALLPEGRAEHCREEECGRTLKFSGFSVQDYSQGLRKLTKSVTKFVRKNSPGKHKRIELKFSHEKLPAPLEVYLPTPSSSRDCDLRVVEELCFAALNRSVSTVDLVFDV